MQQLRLFITATDTGAGKTVLATLLTRWFAQSRRRIAAFKPLCSGNRSDARCLERSLQGAMPLDVINPWHFRQPLAPVVSARLQGKTVTLAAVARHLLTHSRAAEIVLVEGAGGLLSPLGVDFDSRDLLQRMRATPLLVCPNRLGAVNQARLALESLPRGFRPSALLVLMDRPRPDPAAHGNRDLLAAFHPAGRILRFPWVTRWRAPALPLHPPLRRCLTRIASLLEAPE